ncbi:hypothetical protein [Nonomuraea sp. NPDC049028]|uniref:hypothetical protein n=1 Tax=Nonomuraea sp. NPDC049028 TaxID=3364348 RepID=UPI00371640C6
MSKKPLALLSLLIPSLLGGDAAALTSRHAGPTDVQQISEPASRWHLRYAADDISQQIIPTTGNQAWLFVTDKGRRTTSLLHWNATSWQPVGNLPKQLRKATYIDVRASAPGDMVMVINHVQTEEDLTEHLWQFSGGRWTYHRPRRLLETQRTSDFAVLDQNHTWFAQGDGDGGGWMVHLNGTAWRQERLLGTLTTLAAAGPEDVWVVDQSGPPRTLHWDGKQWKDFTLPCVSSSSQHACYGRAGGLLLSSMTARSNNDVWAVGPNWADGALPVVLHWNGTAWNQVKLTVNDHTALVAVRTDPVGGVWIAANPAQAAPYVLNLRDGKWTRSTLPPSKQPVSIVDIAPAAGTTRLWVHAKQGKGTSAIYELQ